MRSRKAVLVFAAQVFALGAVAHGFDWLDTLPDCWQECLSNTSDGCHSSKCVCDASQGDSYLTSAVECAISQCNADAWSLDVTFLGPVEMFCGASGESVPDDIMESAYACATATAAAPSLTTRKVEHSTKDSDHKTTKEGDNGLKSTVTSTITQTKTDGDGNTLQIIIPIVMGPNTMSTGEIVTSTLESKSTATNEPSSAAASPSQIAQASSPAPTQAQGASSSTATAQATQGRTSNSNGSPFENMQAGAMQWSFSTVFVGLGLVAGVLLRL